MRSTLEEKKPKKKHFKITTHAKFVSAYFIFLHKKNFKLILIISKGYARDLKNIKTPIEPQKEKELAKKNCT